MQTPAQRDRPDKQERPLSAQHSPGGFTPPGFFRIFEGPRCGFAINGPPGMRSTQAVGRGPL